MTNTDTADAEKTAQQIVELARAGSELVRITVNSDAAAAQVADIKERVLQLAATSRLLAIFILMVTNC